MNKCITNSLVVALALLMPCLAFALPGAHDPNSGRSYTCNSCHTSGSTIGNKDSNTEVTQYATNVCFRCHKTGGAAGNAASKFETEDFANPFGTVANITQANKLQTSHKWFGSDVVPAAGAVAPVDTAVNGLNKNVYFKGTIFCARCHNVHGTSGTQSLSSPYLRYPNDQDQMCFNCHAPRNTTNHRLGTHPVNITYTSATAKVRIAAGTLRGAPLVNAANPTAQVKLVNGKVVCSTCHGVHNSDSRSSTFDPFSSTHTFGQLSSSKGYLLRVDAYGKTASDTNICTNCHAQYKNHNLGSKVVLGQPTKPVQCNDCHSGHVEYDAAAVGAETTPNIYLVRRYLQYTTQGRISKRVFYRYTGATTKEYYNAPKKGVCQGCHNPPNDHYVGGTPAGAFPEADNANCNGCHKHGETTGSFHYGTGSCATNSCHGLPPASNTAGAGGRYVGYTKFDEGTTPHASHSAGGATYYNHACDQCHKGAGTVMPAYNGIYDEVFINHTGVGIYAGYNANYVKATTTCNQVYCHSNGAGTYKGTNIDMVWGNNKKDTIIGLPGATRCATCHDTTTIATGSHARHVSVMAYGCADCHSSTVTDNTTLSATAREQTGTHVNKVKDVLFSPTYGSGTNCNTVYCHGNGKGAAPIQLPVWGTATTGACGDCHQTKTYGNISSAAHNVSAHISLANDTQCIRCHTYNGETAAPHVNGTINVNYDGTGCAINACHGTITAPVWTVSYVGKDTCTKCHGTLTTTADLTLYRYKMAPDDPAATDTGKVSTTNVKTGAHQTHLRYLNGFSNYSTVDYRCRSCHGITLPASGTHADGTSAPSFQYMATKWTAMTPGWNSASLTCSNTYCHNPAGTNGILDAANVGSRTFVSWTASSYLGDTAKTQANCGKCHKSPGDVGFTSGATHAANITQDCAGCHGHNGDNAGLPGQRHVDGKKYGSGTCDTCHGYPPLTQTQYDARGGTFVNAKVETFNGGYAGGGGYHNLHLLATIVESDGFTPCLPCHPSGSHQQGGSIIRGNVQVNAAADTSYRFDSTRSKRYNSTSWSCSNVSCHFRPTPAWNTAP